MASGTRVEIVDRASFEAWIGAEERPVEWLGAISCRLALRVMPLAMVMPKANTKNDISQILQNLTTTNFRANVISRVANTCPTRDMRGFSAKSTVAAADATIEAVPHITIKSGSAANAGSASASIFAAARVADTADITARLSNSTTVIWRLINIDCRWLEDNQDKIAATSRLSSEQAQQAGLFSLSIWHEEDMPAENFNHLQEFMQSELARESSFGLIADWYRGISGMNGTSMSPFGEEKDLALAQQDEAFWEGEPLDVMDRVAAFVGWERGGEPKTLSPFEYTWNASGVIEMSGDAMARLGVPENRSPEDAKQRIDAARQLANDLVRSLEGNEFQARHSYKNSLDRYCERLPSDQSGSIYLADAEIRNLRDDLAADIAEGLNERFARRLVRVIEQHYGLRSYFPDLLNFYDDIKAGKLTEPPPLEAIAKLQQYISDYTPDVFDENVSESFKEISNSDERVVTESPAIDKNADISTVTLPPDPIADVDPERAKQHAASGALKRINDTLGKVDKGAKNVERAEKVAGLFARYGDTIWEFLSRLG